MKKNILAIAIASVVATPVAFANAPTVYGQFNVALDQVTDAGMNVVHRNSRLGVKGSEDLGNGLKAVYQAEGTLANSGANGDFGTAFSFDRNTFVGLGGGFGTVVMGRHDTPLRMIQPNDGFADSRVAGNNRSAFGGLGGSVAGAVPGHNFSGEDRLNNVLAYISPSFNGIQLALAGATVATTKDAGLSNATSASLSYGVKSKGIYAAVAMTEVDKAVAAAAQRTNTRAVVQYNEAGLVASLMYNKLDSKTTSNAYANRGQSYTLGVSYKMGAITPRAKVAMTDYAAKANKDATSIAAGVDYSLGKNTTVYAEYASLDKNNLRGDQAGTKSTDAVSVGLLHKF